MSNVIGNTEGGVAKTAAEFKGGALLLSPLPISGGVKGLKKLTAAVKKVVKKPVAIKRVTVKKAPAAKPFAKMTRKERADFERRLKSSGYGQTLFLSGGNENEEIEGGRKKSRRNKKVSKKSRKISRRR